MILLNRPQDVVGMISSLEEDVPFSNTIFPADAKGMVRNTKPFIHIIRKDILCS